MLLSEIEELPIMDKIQDTIDRIEELRKELLEQLDDAKSTLKDINPDDIIPDDYELEILEEGEEFCAKTALEKAVANIEEYKGWIEDYLFDSFMVID